MFRQLELSPQQRQLAKIARTLATAQSVLFHGTQSLRSIWIDDTLNCSLDDWTVSFSRSPEIAAYWAFVPRDEPGNPTILVFDRRRLVFNYRLEPSDYWSEREQRELDEMEEVICRRDLYPVSRFLLGVATAEGMVRFE